MFAIEARLIPFARRNGLENMAIDEYLLSWHERYRIPFLRVYGWEPSCISLGRYQRIECLNLEACRSHRVPIVRRITGGGAILHGGELTYSLACENGDLGEGFPSVKDSYDSINAFILEMYRMMRLNAAYAKSFQGRGFIRQRAAFCYSGNEEYDIIIGGMKIGGNAQRRQGTTIFQHGSIPLQIDADSIHAYFNAGINDGNFTALDDISGKINSAEVTADTLIRAFIKTTGWRLYEQGIGAAEQEEIDVIMNEKYRRDSWNLEGRVFGYETGEAGMAG